MLAAQAPDLRQALERAGTWSFPCDTGNTDPGHLVPLISRHGLQRAPSEAIVLQTVMVQVELPSVTCDDVRGSDRRVRPIPRMSRVANMGAQRGLDYQLGNLSRTGLYMAWLAPEAVPQARLRRRVTPTASCLIRVSPHRRLPLTLPAIVRVLPPLPAHCFGDSYGGA